MSPLRAGGARLPVGSSGSQVASPGLATVDASDPTRPAHSPYQRTREEEYELREACWAIVKDSRGMNATGHGAAVRWARAVLGLDDR